MFLAAIFKKKRFKPLLYYEEFIQNIFERLLKHLCIFFKAPMNWAGPTEFYLGGMGIDLG